MRSTAAGAATRSALPPSSIRSWSALSGDEGARRLIARYPAFAIELDDPGILIDIDTAADLESARRGELPEEVPRSAGGAIRP